MAQLFREYTYRVCTYKFEPRIMKISSQDNFHADFLSRHHDHQEIQSFLTAHSTQLTRVEASRHGFAHSADW